MTTYAHAHPLPDGRRFEHTHALPAVCPACGSTVAQWRELPEPPYGWACPECAEPVRDHESIPLAEAHPELARVEQLPAPGSPGWHRQRAAELRQEAVQLRMQAGELERQAARYDAIADQDKQEPPDMGERLRRLLD